MNPPTTILTVSHLNKQIKFYLENEIGSVFVEGEVSNFSKPASGHLYFTLKDTTAQIRCVFFKNRHPCDVFNIMKDGRHIIAGGRLSLYEARGDYQLIVEDVTEAGIGLLYQQFEALKAKLGAEGLFHPERKKPLPLFPKTIGIITSPSGAAIRDILSTLARRFPLAAIRIYPSEVQGSMAAPQLIRALQMADADKRCDVLIIARGGGSIEDLWAFNDEQLARQMAQSSIPIVSGVGHETDFTIADFVADYRAETPTAAAIAVTAHCLQLANNLNGMMSRLYTALGQLLQTTQLRIDYLHNKLTSPHHLIARYWQKLDYLEKQLSLAPLIQQKKHQLHLLDTKLQAMNPKNQLTQAKIRVEHYLNSLTQGIVLKMEQMHNQLRQHLATLHAVSPLATLSRGYAIVCKNDTVLYSTQQIQLNDTVKVQLATGHFSCQVMTI